MGSLCSCDAPGSIRRDGVREIVLDMTLETKLSDLKLRTEVPNNPMVRYSSYANARLLKNGQAHSLYTLIHTAYIRHLGLHLYPDDFQLALDALVSRTINADPDGFRRLFVEHEGKHVLQLTGYRREWGDIVNEFAAAVANSVIDKSFVQHMACDFSTSTPADYVASMSFVLSSVKQYFAFQIEIGCGIPEVYLHGTVDDYKKLVRNAQALAKLMGGTTEAYIIAHWVPILSGLVSEAKGRHSPEFWRSMITSIPGGYGYV